MYMLDTNTCIYVLRNRSEELKRKFKAIRHMCISSITYGELCYGIENGEPHLKEERYRQLDLFLQKLPTELWDEEAAKHYGVIRAKLKKEGALIGSNDMLIAAHARSIDAVLVTNNTKEFKRVNHLTLDDWTLST
jgi:tRNA(fMet)-specific endonuclease VapC